jgi:regulatory protein
MPETSLRERAMRLLARREHSRVELGRKLAAYAEDYADVEALLDELQKRGWLSDERYTEQMVQVRRSKFGSARIAHELREKGVDEALIAGTLTGLKDSELDAARAVWAKKFGELPVDAKERAKQIRFLMSRGFRHDIISRVLRGAMGDDE